MLVDNLGVWKDHQIEYHKKYGNYHENTHMLRRNTLKSIMRVLKANKIIWNQIGKYLNDT